jgi:hypothetical protein
MDVKEVLQLSNDYLHNSVKKYSKDDSREVLRKAIVDLNGGNTTLNKKILRGDSRNALFDYIEILIDQNVSEGLKGNEFFMNMTEQRNLAEGDAPDFRVKPKSNLIVAEIARGTQSLRRQRLGEVTSTKLTPVPHGVKVYEELCRILAGQADIQDLIDQVSSSVQNQMLDDIYTIWNGITSANTGADFYPTAGSYSEDALLDLINHVSAANDGSKCTLVATLKGARKLATTIYGNSAQEDFYKLGYIANWNGVRVQIVPQVHTIGTSTFKFSDSKIHVIPTGMDKPIKQVIGGQSILVAGNPLDKEDFTQEFTLISEWITGCVTGKKFGVYEIG